MNSNYWIKDWIDWIFYRYYVPGLVVVIVISIFGFSLFIEGFRHNRSVWHTSSKAERWLFVVIGIALQVPLIIYIAIYIWSFR